MMATSIKLTVDVTAEGDQDPGRDWNQAFDPRINDPEWAEYQRLHAKFGGPTTSRSTAAGRR